MTAAQDDRLEVVGYLWRESTSTTWLAETGPVPSFVDPALETRALINHATAERQIAELRSRVAELEGAARPDAFDEARLEYLRAARDGYAANAHAEFEKRAALELQVIELETETEKKINAVIRRQTENTARVVARALASEARASTLEAENKGLREAAADVLSHAGDWLTALTCMRDNAEPAGVDHDDRSYWQHQINTMNRVLDALAAKEAGE